MGDSCIQSSVALTGLIHRCQQCLSLARVLEQSRTRTYGIVLPRQGGHALISSDCRTITELAPGSQYPTRVRTTLCYLGVHVTCTLCEHISPAPVNARQLKVIPRGSFHDKSTPKSTGTVHGRKDYMCSVCQYNTARKSSLKRQTHAFIERE